jgi:hypothetical protein
MNNELIILMWMYYKKYNKTILRKLCKIFLIKTFKIKFS